MGKSWPQTFHEFSHDLVPAEGEVKEATENAVKIFEVLRRTKLGNLKIDRSTIMGSVEKKTALCLEFDLDCVIFINQITPDNFQEVKEKFKEILEESNLEIRIKKPNPKGSAMQASINGFEFDLVPAINFSQDNEVQKQKVFEEIKKLPPPRNGCYRFSSSLIYFQAHFIKGQTSFVHDVIRLAKFWNKTLIINDYISGRSTLIELIAVHAAKEVEDTGKPSHFAAFRRFIVSVASLDTLEIIFDSKSYDKSMISPPIMKQRPLVLDPSNPYNNFAYCLFHDPNLRNVVQNYAKNTLSKLNSTLGGINSDLWNVFEVQAPSNEGSSGTANETSSLRWYVTAEFNRGSSKRFKKITKKGKSIDSKLVNLKFWRHQLCFNVRFLKSGEVSPEGLTKVVQEFIDKIEKKKKRHWRNEKEDSHENYPVTFEIPTMDGYVIRCSMDVQNAEKSQELRREKSPVKKVIGSPDNSIQKKREKSPVKKVIGSLDNSTQKKREKSPVKKLVVSPDNSTQRRREKSPVKKLVLSPDNSTQKKLKSTGERVIRSPSPVKEIKKPKLNDKSKGEGKLKLKLPEKVNRKDHFKTSPKEESKELPKLSPERAVDVKDIIKKTLPKRAVDVNDHSKTIRREDVKILPTPNSHGKVKEQKQPKMLVKMETKESSKISMKEQLKKDQPEEQAKSTSKEQKKDHSKGQLKPKEETLRGAKPKVPQEQAKNHNKNHSRDDSKGPTKEQITRQPSKDKSQDKLNSHVNGQTKEKFKTKNERINDQQSVQRKPSHSYKK